MNADINKLYDPIIREHNAFPVNFYKPLDFEKLVEVNNPVCGDRFSFYINTTGPILKEVFFHGFGCAVSKASASVLVRILEGKSAGEAIQICETFLQSLDASGPEINLNAFPDLKPFQAVKEFPARYECAAMAWQEIRKFLRDLSKYESKTDRLRNS